MNQKIAQCHLGQTAEAVPIQRGYKAEERNRKIKFIFGLTRSETSSFRIIHKINNFFISPLCFMNTVARGTVGAAPDPHEGAGPVGRSARRAPPPKSLCRGFLVRGHPSEATGWMAERSKALVSGTSLFGGVGSNPTPVTIFFCRR